MSWNWPFVLEGIVISWPPALIALWFGRRKLHRVTARQTREIMDATDSQTEWLRPGWKHRRKP